MECRLSGFIDCDPLAASAREGLWGRREDALKLGLADEDLMQLLPDRLAVVARLLERLAGQLAQLLAGRVRRWRVDGVRPEALVRDLQRGEERATQRVDLPRRHRTIN